MQQVKCGCTPLAFILTNDAKWHYAESLAIFFGSIRMSDSPVQGAFPHNRWFMLNGSSRSYCFRSACWLIMNPHLAQQSSATSGVTILHD